MAVDVTAGLLEARRRLLNVGHDVRLLNGWRTRGQGPLTRVDGLVKHHTAGANTGPATSMDIVAFGRADLRGMLSQLYSTREWDGRKPILWILGAGKAWHAGDSEWDGQTFLNDDYLGHEAENRGTTSEPWKPSELALSRDMDVVLADVFDYPLHHTPEHKDVARPKGRKPDRHTISGTTYRASLTTHVVGGHTEVLDMLTPDSPTQFIADWQRRLNWILRVLWPDDAVNVLVGATLTGDGFTGGTWEDRAQIDADGDFGSITWTAWVKLSDAVGVWTPKARAPRNRIEVPAEAQFAVVDRHFKHDWHALNARIDAIQAAAPGGGWQPPDGHRLVDGKVWARQ